jgi:hypothetical protein
VLSAQSGNNSSPISGSAARQKTAQNFSGCFYFSTVIDKCRQNAYNVGMATKQYTIRSVPSSLDAFLRRQARLQGKSVNQTVLDYLQRATKLDRQMHEDDFSWIIGSNVIDDTSLQAIKSLKSADKTKQGR